MNMHNATPESPPMIVLGSRSPRRRELLGSFVGDRQLIILPPSSPDEPGFSDVHDQVSIENRLHEITLLKHTDICCQLARQTDLMTLPFVVVADTIVVAQNDSGTRCVLGQPGPEQWADDVRMWFRKWLSGRPHEVWTGVRISRGATKTHFIVRSKVTFCAVSEEMLDWYVATAESTGKAGGYAIQGHAASFVVGLEGGLTNVIGLPMMEVIEGLKQLGWQSHRT
jgi:septum formation protein